MGGLIFFYELKLLPYVDIIPLAWFFIVSSFLSFLFGILTIVSARNLGSKSEIDSEKSIITMPIFADDGKALKYSILFFSFIGFFVAFQRWWVLIHMFGSIPAVLVNAGIIYRLNVNGEIKDFIPILPNFVYVAVFLVGIYTAYKRRFTFLTFLPFISIIIKELTYFGRGEILFSLMEFLFSFLLFRHLLNNESSKKFKFSKKNAIIASTILIIFLGVSASLIRVTRGSYENFTGGSSQLKQLKGNFIISPSIYLYLSCDVGVFSKYLERDEENTKFGQNSFLIGYDFLSKLGILKKISAFQKGYFIPMWANTGTYMRELHADFGIAGLFLGPYLIGLLITWFWFKFYEQKNLIVFAFLVYFYLIVGFSFLVMVTRLNQWYISLFIIIIYLPFLEKMAIRRKSLNLLKE
ncbi:MAG: oligosaccharide repeat unit polymerase [Ignavibacteriaceae bacterium]|nr:oligosaccharide repeat unit polymerase [Ignavibacteriaceae bacterium]